MVHTKNRYKIWQEILNLNSDLHRTNFKTSSQSDVSNLNIGPVTANSSTSNDDNSSSSTGDTPQYATSSNGLKLLI